MKIRNTIFQHLFIRMALILVGVSVAFSFVLMPIYSDKLTRMLATQGNTFANTTVAACGEALYTKDYGFVITYINRVLRQTPEITEVSFISEDGMRLSLNAQGWKVKTVARPVEVMNRLTAEGYLIARSRKIDDSFVFAKPVNISGLDWGVIEFGISATEYDSLIASYLRNVLLFSAVLVVISLLILRGLSMKLAQQLTRLRETAVKLSDGDLSARAPSGAIGEIQLMASTLNRLAASLERKSRRVQQLVRLVEDTNDAIAIFDPQGNIVFVNPAFTRITDRSVEFYSGMSLQEVFDHLGVEKKKQREVLTGIVHVEQLDWSTDIAIPSATQGSVHMTLRVEAFDSDDNELEGFFVVLSDITRRKQLEFELETLAYIDKLTKLPNRRFFMDRLSEAVQEARAFDSGLAVFFLDLDNFKIINDSLGHEIGDFVLSEVAWRIQDALRSDDIVCRLGGDEFTVVINDVTEKAELEQIASSIISELSDPIKYMDRDLRIGASIGIVCFPEDGHNEKELMKNADTAMYAAKHSGKNAFRFFTPDMHREMHDHLELETALRKAIADSDLYLVYQPFLDFETQAILHCEALLRWEHPERGQIPPARFIPIAEQAGLIGEIGDWVFTEVCRQMRKWGLDISVSINVSGSELRDENFIERLDNRLIEYDIAPHRLQLEFTEHVLVSKDGSSLAVLNALKRRGFDIAVDDFGTGFSSLSYLTELPVDVIKIDKSFISKLPHDRRTIAVANSIISLAESLGMKTVGEGVENESQLKWLRAHGCLAIQGYYFYKPLGAKELAELIKSRKAPPLSVVSGK